MCKNSLLTKNLWAAMLQAVGMGCLGAVAHF